MRCQMKQKFSLASSLGNGFNCSAKKAREIRLQFFMTGPIVWVSLFIFHYCGAVIYLITPGQVKLASPIIFVHFFLASDGFVER